MSRGIVQIRGKMPKIGAMSFIAPDAWVLGDVTLGERVSVFFGAVLRGDLLPIEVGSETNIQEHAVLHTSKGRSPTRVGAQCTIGHRAIVHGCTVGDRSLIGMGATILDEAIIEQDSLVAAGALVTEGMHIPARSLVMGVPGKVVRQLTDAEVEKLSQSAQDYVAHGQMYRLKLS